MSSGITNLTLNTQQSLKRKSTCFTDAFRSFRRNRIAPVNHWKNEQLVYEDGNLVGAYLKQPLSSTPKKPKLNSRTKPDCKMPVNKDSKLVLDKVIFPKANWSSSVVVENKDFSILVVGLNKHQTYNGNSKEFRVFGTVLMSGRDSCVITLNQTSKHLSQWDTFIIPKHNLFEIKNLGKLHLKVHLHINKLLSIE